MKPHRTPRAPSLYAASTARKYLTGDERARFIAAANACPRPEVKTLCLLLVYTGCRISEGLALTGAHVHAGVGYVAIRSLKKRGGAIVVREIPLPVHIAAELARVHDLGNAPPSQRLWRFSRCRAWRLVKDVMMRAGIPKGPHATPKGLRHGFGVHAVRSGVPLNLVQRWLGHASMETTAIYLQAMGAEEREIAGRMWG